MKFKLFEVKSGRKIKVTCYSKNGLKYSMVMNEFNKQFPKYKNQRKVNFREDKMYGKYGEYVSTQFDLMLINYI